MLICRTGVDCDERLRRGINIQLSRVVWLFVCGRGGEFVNDLKIDGTRVEGREVKQHCLVGPEVEQVCPVHGRCMEVD